MMPKYDVKNNVKKYAKHIDAKNNVKKNAKNDVKK